MKKKILLASTVLFTGIAFAQMTDANEPAIGESSSMFVCDSLADARDGVTGDGVTWNYTNLGSYDGETRTIEILDATTTPDAGDYPNATKTMVVEGLFSTYLSSDASMKSGEGFIFNEPTFGEVKGVFDVDIANVVTYPFAYGSSLTDAYSGTLYYELSGFPTSSPINGEITASIDGQGTLDLPNNTITDVLRYKSVDSAVTNVAGFGDIEIIRISYEYYDYADQNLPIFLHTTVIMQQPGSDPLGESTLVLSKYEGLANVGLEEEEMANIAVYPNPANNSVTIQGDFVTGKVAMHNALGQQVKSATIQPGESIDVSELEKGLYIITITEGDDKKTTRLVVQ